MDFRQSQKLLELQKTFSDLQEYLSTLHIESDFDGLVITIDGNSNIIQVHIENSDLLKDQGRIEYAIQQAFKKGVLKAREISGERMQAVLQSALNLPKVKNKKSR